MNIKNDPTRKADWPELSTTFNTCTPITKADDIDNLYNHLMNGFSYMAMTNYPYTTSFLTPMPPWPVNVSCGYFKDFDIPVGNASSNVTQANGLNDTEKQVFTALLKAANVYFNNDSSNPNCTNITDTDATGNLDGYGWNVLACNQLAMPTTNGPHSMFINNSPFNYTDYTGILILT